MDKLYKILKITAILVLVGVAGSIINCLIDINKPVEFKSIKSDGSTSVPEKI